MGEVFGGGMLLVGLVCGERCGGSVGCAMGGWGWVGGA